MIQSLNSFFFLQKYKIVKVYFWNYRCDHQLQPLWVNKICIIVMFFFSCHQTWYIPHEKEENKRMIKTKSNQTHCRWIVTRSHLYIYLSFEGFYWISEEFTVWYSTKIAWKLLMFCYICWWDLQFTPPPSRHQ